MFSFFGPKGVSVTEAYEKLGTDGHCLLDVRTKEEVRVQSIPGALNIPLDRLEGQAAKLSGFTSIHVICHSGGRSARATAFLHATGYPHAENVSGGLMAWEAARLPTK